jgi:hypothetical protein
MIFIFQLYVHFVGERCQCTGSLKVQGTTILHEGVVTDGEASSRLDVLSSFSTISLHNLFPTSSDGFRS